jgi:hypothetical protein
MATLPALEITIGSIGAVEPLAFCWMKNPKLPVSPAVNSNKPELTPKP